MTEKGLSGEVADKVGQYVQHNGALKSVTVILDSKLDTNKSIQAGYEDMKLLLSYLVAMGIADKVVFDL
jgi:histidyl-tRNA synthetase